MIEIENLTMRYGPLTAVDRVSFTVKAGEIVGLLGPNGAGKTTIMKILATQIVPSAGGAKVAGIDVTADPQGVRSRLGYLPEQAPLYDNMEVREYLDFVAAGRALGSRAGERLQWVAHRCGLEGVWCTPIGQLSKGYRQRVGLAQALIHDPPVLILDEPTSGLDPIQIIEIRRLVRELAQTKAILFSTHILQEITAITNRMVVINHGRLMADSTLDELIAEHSPGTTIKLALDSAVDVERKLAQLPGIKKVAVEKGPGVTEVRIEGESHELVRRVADLCHTEGWKVMELHQEHPDLEEVFISICSTAPGSGISQRS